MTESNDQAPDVKVLQIAGEILVTRNVAAYAKVGLGRPDDATAIRGESDQGNVYGAEQPGE